MINSLLKSKKGADFYTEGVVQVFSYVALVLLVLVFMVLFNISGCKTTPKPWSVESKIVSSDAAFTIITMLRTPYNDGDYADLIREYCSASVKDDNIKKQILKLGDVLSITTITAQIDCGNNIEIDLRKPLCSNPETIKIPSFSNNILVKYCSLSKVIYSQDGKKWNLVTKDGINYYESGSDSLTLQEYESKYTLYTSTKDDIDQEDLFVKVINAGVAEVKAPNGNKFRKISENMWCLIETTQGTTDCDKNEISQNELIKTKGVVPVVSN
jgi:hypothetical protein